MLRFAGEGFRDYMRENKLANNRVYPIGTGAYGTVYASDVPGNVMKQVQYPDVDGDMEREANLQAIAAEMGIAPKVAGLERFAGGIGNRIEMQDVRDNFEPHGERAREFPTGGDAVRVNQQLGALALKGVELSDRHNANVVYNKMTGRPMQLDFGIGGRVSGEDQVMALANATAEGFEAAGIGDVASIYRDTVYDLLAGGDVGDAMDVAKQGFSRLQKIKPGLLEA